MLMQTIFRVENQDTGQGLWYNDFGEKSDFILSIPDAKSTPLRMDYDPSIAGGWFSGCDNLPEMQNWFNVRDLQILEALGYGLFEIQTPEVRMHMGHAVFRRENATFLPRPIHLLEL